MEMAETQKEYQDLVDAINEACEAVDPSTPVAVA
jgi:hypothetical protein